MLKAKLKFTSTVGKAILTDTAEGDIGLLKENGQWKVFAYKPTIFPKLFKEVMNNSTLW